MHLLFGSVAQLVRAQSLYLCGRWFESIHSHPLVTKHGILRNTMMDRDFERLYTEKFTPIYKYVYFRVKSYDVAMDLCQSIFLKILQQDSDQKIKQETELNYLYTVARNKVIDHFRKKHASSLDNDLDLLRTTEDVTILRPDQLVVRASDIETLWDLLDQLPENDREIVTMRHLQELEYTEIATIVKKEESAIRQIVSRSIKKLKELYESSK